MTERPVRPSTTPIARRKGARAALLIVLGLASPFGVAACAQTSSPPPTGAAEFDHTLLDTLLKKYASKDGWIDYAGLSSESSKLDQYIASLADVKFEQLTRDEQLALLINAYNACTLRLILDHYPLESINDIPAAKRWKDRRWNIAGQTLSLDEIENRRIRPHYPEPRIHFAINCASVGCPPLRPGAYVGEKLDAQLDEQAALMHRDERWLDIDVASKTVRLSKIYDWYKADFTRHADSVLAYAAGFSPELRAALEDNPKLRVQWLEYDWSLNDIKRRP